jgi:hypothetical protein
MPSFGTKLGLALGALAPIFGTDGMTKVLSMGLRRGGKVPAKKKAKKAKKRTKK